eukprot:Skav212422  [mRNA]  locus=scaffold202:93762:94223:+ [translate_table: standard]
MRAMLTLLLCSLLAMVMSVRQEHNLNVHAEHSVAKGCQVKHGHSYSKDPVWVTTCKSKTSKAKCLSEHLMDNCDWVE